MTRRGLFGVAAAMLAGRKLPLPVPVPTAFVGGRVEYFDTDSVVISGGMYFDCVSRYPELPMLTVRRYPDHPVLNLSRLYGKLGRRG